MDGLFEAGRVLRAHGVKGELHIRLNVESPSLLWDYIYLEAVACARERPAPERFTTAGLRLAHGRAVLSLEEVRSRDEAEKLRGRRILAPEERLPPPGKGEVYLRDLAGLAVFTEQEGALVPLGRLAGADATGGQELWRIVTPEGKEILFPASPEFVRRIDLQGGLTVIAPPAGLLELYLSA